MTQTQQTMTKHAPATPLPWHLGIKQAEQIVYDAKGWAVVNATVYHGHADDSDSKENAAYIVAACNAYPRLVAALRSMGEYHARMNPEWWGRSDARAMLLELGEST